MFVAIAILSFVNKFYCSEFLRMVGAHFVILNSRSTSKLLKILINVMVTCNLVVTVVIFCVPLVLGPFGGTCP